MDLVDHHVAGRRCAGLDQGKGLPGWTELPRELAENRDVRPITGENGRNAFSQCQEAPAGDDCSQRESVFQTVQPPVGEIKGGTGIVIDFHIGGTGRNRVIHDLIDDQRILRRHDRSGVIHVVSGAKAGQLVAQSIEALNQKLIRAGVQHHAHRPIGDARKCDWIRHIVEGHCYGLDGKRRPAGEHEQIVSRAHVIAAAD